MQCVVGRYWCTERQSADIELRRACQQRERRGWKNFHRSVSWRRQCQRRPPVSTTAACPRHRHLVIIAAHTKPRMKCSGSEVKKLLDQMPLRLKRLAAGYRCNHCPNQRQAEVLYSLPDIVVMLLHRRKRHCHVACVVYNRSISVTP